MLCQFSTVLARQTFSILINDTGRMDTLLIRCIGGFNIPTKGQLPAMLGKLQQCPDNDAPSESSFQEMRLGMALGLKFRKLDRLLRCVGCML
jgi:hypothetical protein